MLFWGLTHAALSKYQQKGQAVRESCQAERAKLTPQQLKQTNPLGDPPALPVRQQKFDRSGGS
jgi:hypothetical protein